MAPEELAKILELHQKWLYDTEGGDRANLRRANLQDADLRRANLRRANLQDADLQDADLRRADLRRADLDFACWPLWCGSLGVKADTRVAAQIAYHFCRLDCDDPEYLAARSALLPFANTFHRVDECGRLSENTKEEV